MYTVRQYVASKQTREYARADIEHAKSWVTFKSAKGQGRSIPDDGDEVRELMYAEEGL